VKFNGQYVQPFSGTITELLDAREIRREGIAVAVNGEIVPRSEWSYVRVGPDASVEVVTAAAGG
jgi:sulfur carrier protein